VITRIRRWIARALATALTVLTLGRLAVRADGALPAAEDTRERPTVSSPVDQPSEGRTP